MENNTISLVTEGGYIYQVYIEPQKEAMKEWRRELENSF